MWAEGMCDVLSLPLCRVVELPIVCESRYQLYLSSAWQARTPLPYQDYAGRMIRWSQRNKVDARSAKELKKVLPQLWEMELASTLAQPLSRRPKSVPAGAGQSGSPR
jgi:hypothetical protein